MTLRLTPDDLTPAQRAALGLSPAPDEPGGVEPRIAVGVDPGASMGVVVVEGRRVVAAVNVYGPRGSRARARRWAAAVEAVGAALAGRQGVPVAVEIPAAGGRSRGARGPEWAWRPALVGGLLAGELVGRYGCVPLEVTCREWARAAGVAPGKRGDGSHRLAEAVALLDGLDHLQGDTDSAADLERRVCLAEAALIARWATAD